LNGSRPGPDAIQKETVEAGEPANALAQGIRQAKKLLIARHRTGQGKLQRSRKALGGTTQPLVSPDSPSKLEAEARAVTAHDFIQVNEWQSLTP
jgi:hypothetical protein